MINDRVDTLILKNLIYNENYCKKVLPFIKPEYFDDLVDRTVFEKISSFINKYNTRPTKESLAIDSNNDGKLADKTYQGIVNFLDEIHPDESPPDFEWLVNSTEKFCKDRAIHNAVRTTVGILQDEKIGTGEIPKILSDALSVCFDADIGHDYFDDSDKRYEFYHRPDERIPSGLKFLDRAMGGGASKKTLNVVMAGTNVGKSLFLCHLAGSYLVNGKNVLYITLEMQREKTAQRVDANLLNVSMDDLKLISKINFDKRIAEVRKKTVGKLIVREYPPTTCSVTHMRALLQELKIMKGFVPEVIILDYLNIAKSSRISQDGAGGSYSYIKAIAEEVRGLTMEYNVPIWSATQLNRSGYTNTDPGLEDTSESFGLPATVDFMMALIATDELKAMNQIMVKKLKDRDGDADLYKRFMLGIDKNKMRFYDIDEAGQQGLVDVGTVSNQKEDDTPLFDKTSFGKGQKAEQKTDFNDWLF